MKQKDIALQKMSEIFCDLDLVPKKLVKNYYLLVADMFNEDELIKNSIIFKSLDERIGNLKEKQRNYIIAKYGLLTGNVSTLADVGSIYGVSRESVRQIINKAITELKSSTINFYLPHRINHFTHLSEEIQKEIKRCTELLDSNCIKLLTVDDFNLSVRAKNVLNSNKIITYEQLMQLTPEKLMRMRNIGRKTANEIWFKLYGEYLPTNM